MKQHSNPYANRRAMAAVPFTLAILLAILLAWATSGIAQAAPGTLSQVPLYLNTTVEPNIVFLADDSGSFWTLASEEVLLDMGLPPPADGVWRARNSDYNRIYYNPAVTYKPWKGVNINGDTYTDSPPTAAWLDPYDPSAGTMDLTALVNYFTPGRDHQQPYAHDAKPAGLLYRQCTAYRLCSRPHLHL